VTAIPGPAALSFPAESQAIPEGPNRTDLGTFCALGASDCWDFTTGDYGDPNCGPSAKLYATSAYIRATNYAGLCSQAKRWVATDL
jgi:hypothetical protein